MHDEETMKLERERQVNREVRRMISTSLVESSNERPTGFLALDDTAESIATSKATLSTANCVQNVEAVTRASTLSTSMDALACWPFARLNPSTEC
jgi:hypothetical protein